MSRSAFLWARISLQALGRAGTYNRRALLDPLLNTRHFDRRRSVIPPVRGTPPAAALNHKAARTENS
jgi:hypothetical protein